MMAIEDTVGYRFVRISLVLLNCLVLVRLVSLLLQYSHVFEPIFVLFVLLIGSNFMAAIIGAIREHRISVMITGSVTLIMFLSLIFTAKENKTVNVSLLTLLAIAVQSLIFSEMLKERQTLQRRGADYIASTNNRIGVANASQPSGGPLAAVVVYQTSGSNRAHPGSLFMIDPVLGSELPKDAPPSYFSSNCPPPKYEDAIKLNANEQSLPIVPPATVVLSVNEVTPSQSGNDQSESTTPSPVATVPVAETVQQESPQSSNSSLSTSPSSSQDNNFNVASLDKSTPTSQPPPYSDN